MKRKQISKIVSEDKIFVVYQVESVYKEKALIQVNYFLLEYVDIKGGVAITYHDCNTTYGFVL